MSPVEELISRLRRSDIKIWVDGDRVRCRASKETLTPDIQAEIISRRAEILEFLHRAGDASRGVGVPEILPASRANPMPVSFSQQRLWFLNQFEGASSAYNMPGAVRLEGSLDASALQRSLDEIVRRHEILRANFREENGAPVQVISPAGPTALPVIDLSVQPESCRASELKKCATREAQRPFDIVKDPLIRAALYRMSSADHVLLVNMHHIVCDGWSVRIFIRELASLYEAFSTGKPSPLPDPAIQYVDFAAWQRREMNDERLGPQMEYWKKALAGIPNLLELPTDRARPPVMTFEGASVRFHIDDALVSGLKQFCRRTGTTPFMALFSVFATLLQKYSGQDDIVIGTPVANRRPEFESLIGFFVNTLPLRADLSGDPAFEELLARVRQTSLDALAAVDVPFEHLVDVIQPERNMGHSPLFQAGFDFQTDPVVGFELPGIRITPYALELNASKFDLSLSLQQTPAGLSGEFEYNSDLFDAATVERIAAHYTILLDRALSSSSHPISELSMLTQTDLDHTASGWNSSADADQLDPPSLCFPQLFERQAALTPHACAVADPRRQMTFDELNRAANRLSRRLRRMGVKPDHAVGLCLDRSVDQVVALLAILKSGGAYLPLDTSLPAERLLAVLNDSKAELVVTSGDLAGRFASAKTRIVYVDGGSLNASPGDDENLPASAAPEHLAYVIYTSGSTGRPKGVMVEHRNVIHLFEALKTAVYRDIPAGPLRVSVNGAVSFDTSVKQIVQLLAGHALVIVPEAIRFDSPALLDYVRAQRIDVLDCTPSQLEFLITAGVSNGDHSPQAILVGGESIGLSLWKEMSTSIRPQYFNVYGPTECTVDATVCRINGSPNRPVIGRPISNVRVYILDRHRQLVPVGVPGEIYIGGMGVARGYLNNAEETAARFVPNPFGSGSGDRLYRTGDRGRRLQDGTVEFLGRADHQVKLRGFRIELGEIERALETHPGVHEAVVSVREDRSGAKRLVAHVVPTPPSSATIAGKKRYRLPNGLAIAHLNKNETDFLYREMFEIGAYRKHGISIRPGDCIFDVGANIGMFSLSAHVACPDLTIYAFEPNPFVHSILGQNVKLFGINSRVFNCGLADSVATADFTFYPKFSILSGLYADPDDEKAVVRSFIRRRHHAGSAADGFDDAGLVEKVLDEKFEKTTLPVHLRPLSEIIQEHHVDRIDLLKINVEKSELDVLEGITAEDWPKIRQIALELHDIDSRLTTVGDLLKGHGFLVEVERDWSLEEVSGTNYYLYATRPVPDEDRPEVSPEDSSMRIRSFAESILSGEALQEYLRARLPEYMAPSVYDFLEEMPLNRNGKVDRRLLSVSPVDDSVDKARSVLPGSPEEELLEGIWSDILGRAAIGVHDNFFQLGGHSLMAAQVISRIRDVLAVELPIKSIFESPTISGLAGQIVAAQSRDVLPPIRPMEGHGDGPLSFSQQRLWFLHQLQEDGALYAISGAVRMEGALDVEALSMSVREIVRRHEVLRTVYPALDGIPTARLTKTAPEFERADFGHLPPQEWEAERRKLMDEWAGMPFDLENGPLVRVRLVRMTEKDHLFLVSMHHMVSDGWSIGVFVRELSAHYRRFVEGVASSMPDLPIQYVDVADWQRQHLSGERMAGRRTYWRSRLAGVPEILNLPADRPRPSVQTYRGAARQIRFSPDLTSRLRQVGQKNGATMFMTMLSAFSALLSRYSREEDIVIGSPIANRPDRQSESLIGFFVNTLVYRMDLRGNPRFSELLRRARLTALDAYAHQDMPFEQMVEDLQPVRSLDRHPLFQVMFVYQNAPAVPLELPGLKLTPVESDSRVAKFDLTLTLEEAPEGLRGTMEYNSDLFDRETIDRMIGHLRLLTETATSDPDRRIGEIEILTEPERRQMARWNDTQREFPEVSGIHRLFEKQAAKSPSEPAVEFQGRMLTYDEVNRESNRLANHLIKLGVKPDSPVGICLDRSVEMVVAVLGVLKAGGAYVPLDPNYPRARLAFMIKDAGLSLILTQSTHLSLLTGIAAKLLMLDPGQGDIPREPDSPPNVEPCDDHLAYVIYTSGSTGNPKGVMLTHAGLCNTILAQIDGFHVMPADRVLQFASFSFDASVSEIFTTLCSGACLCLISKDDAIPGGPLMEFLRNNRITHVTLPPSSLAALPSDELPDVRVLIVAGEPCPADLVTRWAPGRRMINAYGPTEATICATLGECLEEFSPESVRPPSIGRPIANTQIHILDAGLHPSPAGVPGEIYIGGRGVARGYFNRPDLTRERFVSSPFGRIYKTGDIGRYRGSGSIEFLGRDDQQVKLRGFRIEPGEIESALISHPTVQDAVVVLRGVEPADRHLIAFVILRQTAQPADTAGLTQTLRRHLLEKIPGYMTPSVIVFRDRLPLTPNGKVDRRELAAMNMVDTAAPSNLMEPATPDEKIVAEIWKEILKRERISIRDNFFELGGHSLSAARVISRIRAAFESELPVRAIFEHPTIEELAIQARHAGSTQQAFSGNSVSDGAECPLTSAQQRLWFLNELDGPGSAYHIPSAVRLTGAIDRRALEKSLDEIIRRHASLRMVFPAENGRPRVAWFASRIQLEVVDLAGKAADISRQINETSTAPFDLARGPLIRTRLLRLSADEHVLVIVLHHIVADGWSVGVLMRELAGLYEAFASGDPSPLKPLSMTYADFARAQKTRSDGGHLAGQTDYWKRQLSGSPDGLELPAGRRRPAIQTFAGRSIRFDIPIDLSASLTAFAAKSGATPFMTLLAVYAAMLSRYSGQTDIVVGTPAANRASAETESLIGLFVNTLALRCDLDGNPDFISLLARIRRVCLDAYAHPDVPFERIIEEVRPGRNLAHSPLFQTMFVMQTGLVEPMDLGSVRLEPIAPETRTAKFDLTLFVDETPSGFECVFEFNSELFDESAVRRMAGHFRTMIENITAHPELRVDRIPMMTDAEYEDIRKWNDTIKPFPSDKPFHRLFEERVEKTPDVVAAVYEGLSLTYVDLNTRANHVAHYLRSIGVDAETPVAIMVERSLDLIVGLLGILKSGGAYVPLDPAYPAPRLKYMLTDSRASVLLTQEKLLSKLPEGPGPARVVCLDRDWPGIESNPASNPADDTRGGQMAYVIYTSGSTGNPKGAMIHHRGLVNYVTWAADRYRASEGNGVPVSSSISFDATITSLFVPLLAGNRIVLLPEKREMEILGSAHRSSDDYTLFKMTPSHLDMLNPLLMANPSDKLARALVIGGEALAGKSLDYWKVHSPETRVINEYGPTETVVGCCIYDVKAKDAPSGNVPIGRPISNMQMYILDKNMRPVPVGFIGEIYISGAGVGLGYFNRPELTAERFLDLELPPELLPSGVRSVRAYRTGDLARYLPDGDIEYMGRIDHQIKLRGYRIEPGEIESALAKHPAVRQAAVIVCGESSADKRLVAYAVLSESLDIAVLRKFLTDNLPGYMVPSAFVILDELPLTPNGKLDIQALPKSGAAPPSARTAHVPPRDPREQLLAELFASVTGAARVGIDDDFFDMGGHSLLATQLVSRVRETFGVDIPLRAIFESPTVAGLIGHIRLARKDDAILDFKSDAGLAEPELTFAQQRLWFLDRLAGHSPAYNLPAVLKLTGKLDRAALEKSLREIIRRHVSLRLSFPDVDGRPTAHISETLFSLPVEDWASLENVDRAEKIRRRSVEEMQKPFDLSTGPLFRASLIKLSDDEHVLLATMHHIVSDGWSTGIFINELSVLYEAFVKGEPSPLPPLAIQYTDFAVWQRSRLAGETLERLRAYWTGQLAGAPAKIELPTDRPRPAIQTYAGATVEFCLEPDLADRVRSVSRHAGATPFMTMLSAFSVLLSRYTGQQDIVVGTPIANRTRREIEPLIGLFVNTLAIRTRIDDNPAFETLVRRVRQTCLDAYAHQDIPFEQLVDELNPERNLSHSPIYQVLFVMQNTPKARISMTGLDLEWIDLPGETSKLDLSLFIEESDRGMRAVLEYNTDLFDKRSMERMAGHFCELLRGLVADPARAVESAPLLTDAERLEQRDWNRTEKNYGDPRLIFEMFENRAATRPGAPALVYDGKTMTYGELNRRSSRLATLLNAAGVGPESPVCICVERSFEMVIGLMGIMKSGGAYVPMDPEYPRDRIATILDDARPKVLLTQSKFNAAMADAASSRGVRVVSLDVDPALMSDTRDPPASLRPAVVAENMAYIIYTSGSTGKPKGVINTHGGIRNRLLWMQDMYALTQDDRVLQKTPYTFDVSVWEFFWPLMVGARIVLAAPGGHRDSSYLVRLIREQAITTLHFVPSMMQVFVEEPGVERCGTIRQIFASGEALPYDLQERAFRKLNAELHNLYGPTEAAVDVTYWRCRDRASRPNIVPIGRPVSNTQIYILDPHLNPMPAGLAGELCIGGAQVARGYLNRPELTAEKFIPNPSRPGDRLYKTGDLARFLSDGTVEYLGRLDHQVKIRGFRIELGEIESVLTQHPAVREAVVTARADASGHKRLIAYVVVSRPPTGSASDSVGVEPVLRAFLKEKLPNYMTPSVFLFLESFQLNANGKVDRKALPAPESATRAPSAEYAAPETDAEKILALIWMEILKLESVGVNDNFFELGGDSILNIQVVSRAKKAGLNLTPKMIFLHQTISELSRAALSSAVPAAQQGIVSGPVDLTPIQTWFFEDNPVSPEHFNQSTLLEVPPDADASALRRALEQILLHHDALRLRFEHIGGAWVARIHEQPGEIAFEEIDLSAVSPDSRRASMESAAAVMQTRLNLSAGPIVRAALFRFGQTEPGRMLIVIHHLAVDGVSWRIVIDDLARAYDRICRGESPDLPAKTTSYQEWASRLISYSGSDALQSERDYWRALAQVRPIPLPVDYLAAGRINTAGSVDGVDGSLDEKTTKSLLTEVHTSNRSRIHDALLSALVHTLGEWSGSGNVLIDVEGHGREDIFDGVDVSRTVGWFTGIYPVVLSRSRAGGPRDALGLTRTELEAVPKNGIGYGILKYIARDLSVRNAPTSETLFNYLGQIDTALSSAGPFRPAVESSGPAQSPARIRRHLLEITVWTENGKLRMRWDYSRAIHRCETIENLARKFEERLRCLSGASQDAPDVALSPVDIESALRALNFDERGA